MILSNVSLKRLSGFRQGRAAARSPAQTAADQGRLMPGKPRTPRTIVAPRTCRRWNCGMPVTIPAQSHRASGCSATSSVASSSHLSSPLAAPARPRCASSSSSRSAPAANLPDSTYSVAAACCCCRWRTVATSYSAGSRPCSNTMASRDRNLRDGYFARHQNSLPNSRKCRGASAMLARSIAKFAPPSSKSSRTSSPSIRSSKRTPWKKTATAI